MPAVQMNTRISKDLKTRGDAALAKAGYTPTEAVRLLWGWAASQAHDPEKIDRFFKVHLESSGPAKNQEVARKLQLVSRASSIVDEFLVEAQLAAPPALVNRPFHELKEEALWERYQERGLL